MMAGVDDADIYSFTLSTPQVIQIVISGINDRVAYDLIHDTDGNGNIDSGEIVLSQLLGGNGGSGSQELLPGTYYLRMRSFDSGTSTPYTLTLTPGAAGLASPNTAVPRSSRNVSQIGVVASHVARSDASDSSHPSIGPPLAASNPTTGQPLATTTSETHRELFEKAIETLFGARQSSGAKSPMVQGKLAGIAVRDRALLSILGMDV